MSAPIFISYRRSDSSGHAGRLFDRLSQWFDAEALFYDLRIDSGQVFPPRLEQAVNAAKVVLVLIGPGWFDELNRRAALPETDYVRREIELALQRRAGGGDMPVIVPVLLGGVAPPAAGGLHESLRDTLAPLCAFDVHTFQGKNDDWQHQFVRLRGLIAAVPGVPAPRYRPPAGTPQPFRVIEQRVSPHFRDPNDTLADLQQALEATGSAAVVSPAAIYGMGGVGKTQLALKYSHEFRDRYAGVWWLRAETDDTLQLDARECCLTAGAPLPDGELPTRALKRWLAGQQAPWLLVFDNAEDPAALRAHLPDGGGHHVLITSRNPAWGGIARPVATKVWTPEQGADFLASRLPGRERHVLRELAWALGGLPLALEQAAGFLDETAMAVAEYTAQVRGYASAPLVLDEGRSATGYERSVLATLSIAYPRLGDEAALLLRLLAFCAPEPVPERLFRERPEHLPEPLGQAAREPLRWEKAIAALRRYGLAERVQIAALDREPGRPCDRAEAALHVHRLTQEVARHRLTETESDAGALLALLQDALPVDAELPAHWPVYASLAPHVLQIDRLSMNVVVETRRLSWVLDRIGIYLQRGPSLFATSRAAFERSLALNRRDLGEEHPVTLGSMSNLATTLYAQGDLSGARELQQKSLDVRRRVLGEEDSDTLVSMNNLAGTLRAQGDLLGARELRKKSLDVRRRVLGDEHPDTLASMNNLGETLRDQGDLSGARELQQKSLDVCRRVRGEEHPDTLSSMDNLAATLHDQGDLSGARELQQKSLDVRRRVLAEEHPDTLISMNNLARTLYAQGDLSGARDLQQKSLDVCRRVLGEEHPNTLIWMTNFAQTLYAQGDLSGARDLQQKSLDVCRRVLGEEHPNTLISMTNLTVTLWQAGESANAIALMKSASEGWATKLGPQHPHAISSRELLDTMLATVAGEAVPPPVHATDPIKPADPAEAESLWSRVKRLFGR